MRAVGLASGLAYVDGAEPFSRRYRVSESETLASLVSRLSEAVIQQGRYQREPGSGVLTVLVDVDTARELRMGTRPPGSERLAQLHPAVRECQVAGWEVKRLGPWTSLHARGRTTVHVCVPAWLPEHRQWLTTPDIGASVARVARYADLTGVPFHIDPGVSGLSALVGVPRKTSVLWTPPDPPTVDCRERAMTATLFPADGADLHWYDQNAAYLAAAQAVTVAAGGLEHTGPIGWTRQRAGYWRVLLPSWPESRIPHPAGIEPPTTRDGRRRGVWVTGPTMQLLAELATNGWCEWPEITDSWTGTATRAVFTSWAERLRDALAAVRSEEQMRVTLKATYTHAYGQLATDTGRVRRPDWAHTLVAQHRVSLWRRLWRIGIGEGRWPVAIDTDNVAYAARTADPVADCPAGLRLGQGFGTFRVHRAPAGVTVDA